VQLAEPLAAALQVPLAQVPLAAAALQVPLDAALQVPH
jgi:hypothetical protein